LERIVEFAKIERGRIKIMARAIDPRLRHSNLTAASFNAAAD
jgi:hypothetical protein